MLKPSPRSIMTPPAPACCSRSAAKRLLPVLLSVLATGLSAGSSTVHAQQAAIPGKNRVALSANFRPVAAAGKGSKAAPAEVSRDTLTPAEAAEPIRVEIVLKNRHFAELERRVAAGEVISRQEMAARFLPDEAAYRNVSQWLSAQGLTVEEAGAGHMVVAATGTPAQLQQAFGTRFARVKFRGEEFSAAVAAPSLPADIEAQVSGVHGLQPYLHPHKHAAILKDAVPSNGAPPFITSEIGSAYNLTSTGLTGAGEQIGIVIDSLPNNSDLTKFWSDNGVPQSLSNIVPVNVRGRSLPAATGEETLDVSWSSGLASGAQIVIYACGDLNYVRSSYSRIVDDLQNGARPGLHQVSMSYGAGEQTDETPADMNSTHQLFTTMAAYGVSLFAASGDDGPYADGDGVVQVCYPASDPFVTGVGGTSLYLDPGSNTISEEDAWSVTGSKDDSSGGGLSQFFAQPAWQVGTGVPGGGMRAVPDVAFVGDPDTGCYLVFNGRVKQFGGTSLGTPAWAGLCALLNQSRVAHGLSPLGNLNTAIYPQLGKSSFHDITSGDNGKYNAGAGYDLVTGLGTPNLGALVQAVASAPAVPAPVISSSGTAESTVGADFTYVITAINAPTSFGASNLPDGLNFDPARGLIAGTTPAAGTYNIPISATNAGGTSTATLVLTVSAPDGPPSLSLWARQPLAIFNAGQLGSYKIHLSNASPTDLIVHYTLGGNAVNGTDYNTLRGAVRIPAGRLNREILVFPTGSLKGTAHRNLLLTLDEGDGYTVPNPHPVKVIIYKNPPQ